LGILVGKGAEDSEEGYEREDGEEDEESSWQREKIKKSRAKPHLTFRVLILYDTATVALRVLCLWYGFPVPGNN
jgi:hypothetical protein